MADLRHYEVVAPEQINYPSGWALEPPEPFRCWGIFLATSKRDAIVQAVKAPEFEEWVNEARGDRVPPFKGLVASLTVCEHGACWACRADDDDLPLCRACRADMEAEEARFMAEVGS